MTAAAPGHRLAVPLRAPGERPAGGTRRHYLFRPARSHDEMAARVAALIPDGGSAGLGPGLPALVARHLRGRDVVAHPLAEGLAGGSAVVLAGHQVDAAGNVAPAHGATDLIPAGSPTIVIMEQRDRAGEARLVECCSVPVAGRGRADVVVTDLALFRRGPVGFVLCEIVEGFSVAEVLALTGCPVVVAPGLGRAGRP